MSQRAQIGLDNQAFRGRLRRPFAEPARPAPPAVPESNFLTDYITHISRPSEQPNHSRQPFEAEALAETPVPFTKPTASPAVEAWLQRPVQTTPQPQPKTGLTKTPPAYSKLQISLFGMACLIFMIGVAVSLDTVRANRAAEAQVSALSQQVNQQAAGNAVQSLNPALKPKQ